MKPKQERKEIILKALTPGANISHIAREHGISRQSVYAYLEWVTDDPEGRLRQAEDEVEFRRKVWELVR